MSNWHGGRLDAAQSAWVAARVPDAVLVRDMSWGLVDTTVLHVRSGPDELVVKAAGPSDTHLPREIAAHPTYAAPLIERGRAARLRDASSDARVILLDFLPGDLVLGADAEWSTETYAQAGELLRLLHEQEARPDADYEARATAKALHWLGQPHRLDPDVASRARDVLQAAPAPRVTLVPTHGDWHPRNWLIDYSIVRVIDFGRFASRERPRRSAESRRVMARSVRDSADLRRSAARVRRRTPAAPQ